MQARRLLSWSVALLLGILVLALTLIALPPGGRPLPIERLWPGHPTLLIERAMAEVGRASAQSTVALPRPTIDRLHLAAARAPLSPEPYLVEGTLADTLDQADRAGDLLRAARLRDPRAPAARYLLALHDLDGGRPAEALREMTALGRLMPSSRDTIAAALAGYARQPGAADKLRALVKGDSETEQRLLATLARDPSNAALILQIAGPGRPRPEQTWPRELLSTMMQAGMVTEARAAWQRLSGERDRGPVFRPDFRPSPAPPPFNWSLASASGAALLEARKEGGLDVVYYGRDAASLASQTLVLAPGRYRLSGAHSAAQTAGALQWAITCDDGASLAVVPLANGVSSEQTIFNVPAMACRSQRLELRGQPGEVASQVSLTIHRIDIEKVAG